MTETTAAGALRSLFAAATASGLATALARAAWRLALELPGSPLRVENAVAAIVVAGGAAAAAVLAAGSGLLLLGAVARLTGRTWRWCDRAAARVTPAVLRRAIAVTVTTGLGVTGATGAAGASEIDLGWALTEDGTQTVVQTRHPDDPVHDGDSEPDEPTVADLATPEEADAGAQRQAAPVAEPTSTETEPDGRTDATGDAAPANEHDRRTEGAPSSDDRQAPPGSGVPSAQDPDDRAEVTVTTGDSLWAIARDHLPDPSDSDVAAHWPRWYAANRAVIGPDPDLIHPGQILLAPTEETTLEETAR